MKFTTVLISTVALSLSAAVQAEQAKDSSANSNTVVAVGGNPDQQCNRWADYQNLKDGVRAEYIKDCQLDLRVPDKKEEGGGD